MKANKYKIDLEIFIVFLIVIGISVFNVIYSSSYISRNQNAVHQVMETEIPSLQKMEETRLLINQSVMYTTRRVYLPENPDDVQRLETILNIDFPNIKNALYRLSERWNESNEVTSINKIITGFEKLIDEEKSILHQVSDFDDFENAEKHFKAEEILENTVIPHSKALANELNTIIIQKQSHVDKLHEEINSFSRTMLISIQGIAILIIIVIVMASLYISQRMIMPILRLKNNILQMGKGEIPDISTNSEKNAVGLMSHAVQSLAESLRKTTQFAHKIGSGNLSAEFQPVSEKDELGNALLQMRNSLRFADDENKKRQAFSHFTEKINHALHENIENIDELSNQIISILVKALKGYQGGIYLIDDQEGSDRFIKLHGSYAAEGKNRGRETISLEEGLIGQVIKDGETIYLRNVSNGRKLIYSGFNSYSPSHVLIVPLKHHEMIYGAVEISGFSDFQDFELEFIKGIGETIGTTIANVKANTLTKQLLLATREQTVKLAIQEEELRRTNIELSNQSNRLQASEEELKQSNTELKEKARELHQKNEFNEMAREALSLKAKELELSNKYKSEFLANMSHELRTPLNSLLILAKLLEENKEKNLSPKQKEYANVIHKSGKNLLALINDILDLSKIEAGKMQVMPEATSINSVCEDMRMLFEEMATEKNIVFKTELDPNLPESFISDKIRLEQIIKNLLSNAIKFTPSGGQILFEIKRPPGNISFTNKNLRTTRDVIEFSVTDTGIGVPKEKQTLIFEAFQQADGSINRSYGGTGLGLSISKMLVGMLGGELGLESEHGEGSRFYFHLPMNYFLAEQKTDNLELKQIDMKEITSVNSDDTFTIEATDDRDKITEGDKVLLIVGEDKCLAGELLDKAHKNNFKGVIATNSDQCFRYAVKYQPAAILVDCELPSVNGRSVLNEIKETKLLAKIPVHVISPAKINSSVVEKGLFSFLRKPIDKKDLENAFVSIDNTSEKPLGRILLVEDSAIDNEIVRHLLASHFKNIEIKSVTTRSDAEYELQLDPFDFIILDLDLGNGHEEGLQLLEKIRSEEKTLKTPILVFTGQCIDETLAERITGSSAIIISKSNSSMSKLIEEAELFLHNVSEMNGNNLPDYKIPGDILTGKKILIVDNDMRSIYSISKSLTDRKMIVEVATSSDEIISFINKTTLVDIILYDLKTAGSEAFKLLDDLHQKYSGAPVITLTTKSSITDREKSILHGASDYISKPIDMNQLYSLLRVWLYKE